MNKYALEVERVGGKDLVEAVKKEFQDVFYHIVARDQDMIVLGSNEKNVMFCRKSNKVKERFFLGKNREVARKKIGE